MSVGIPGVGDPRIKYNNQPSAVVLVPLILPSGTTTTATITVSPTVSAMPLIEQGTEIDI
jgi:hypothetical protein